MSDEHTTSPQPAAQPAPRADEQDVPTKVIFVGVGGATCSGKTTLAKHLRRILPNSVIIHQDVRYSPMEEVPLHPVHGVQDWDSAPGAISWARMVTFLRHVKETGVIPPDHRSHDHLNEQQVVPVPDELADKWRAHFQALQQKLEAETKEKIIWGLVDGFLLYWNHDVVDQLDVKFFLRVPHDALKKRRHDRHGYHTAEGALWRDPPQYWENIVYPAYVEAHRHLFVDGDVEHGKLASDADKLVLLETLEMTMGNAVEKCCSVLDGALGELHPTAD
ncbi:ribosylnicotinamide kinase [Pleurotus ostreatus]|uniref:Ribosylnicotinamide kinase n=1 Tax=Pleurotus ostreatus TaxID=5322 RepID=A0A8H6ZUI3_PLEOS|nr:ribosylnicotinamide kinase [Pleurotus ostreatus]KAF7428531.1 ribosylnicotinamide kinase [Pleurotus ostreatus]